MREQEDEGRHFSVEWFLYDLCHHVDESQIRVLKAGFNVYIQSSDGTFLLPPARILHLVHGLSLISNLSTFVCVTYKCSEAHLELRRKSEHP